VKDSKKVATEIMKYPTLDNIDCHGKTVFVRVDYNVSLTNDGQVRDDARIRASLPTLTELRKKGAKLILASHLGRPKGRVDSKFTLLPVAKRLAELLEVEVLALENCIGMEVKKLINDAKENQVILLENLRFHPEEEACDEGFSQKLSELAQIYVNDAFGTMHRAHASTVGMVKFFKEHAIGRLVENEVGFLSRLLHEPEKPYVVILGGAKISDKIDVIKNLINVADKILVGGGMAYTFLLAQGHKVGKSLVEESKVSLAKRLMERAQIKGVNLLLPVDSIIAEKFAPDASSRVVSNEDDWADWMGLDIGPHGSLRNACLSKRHGCSS
jgi:phosphoglycerate kinase